MPNAFYPAGIMLYNNYYYDIIIGMRIVVCKWSIRTLKSSTWENTAQYTAHNKAALLP